MIALYLILILIVIFAWPLDTKGAPTLSDDKWTVFGSMKCGWTRKQLDHMKSKNIPHEFVDCDKGKCPPDVKGFPTLRNGDKENVGFTKDNLLE